MAWTIFKIAVTRRCVTEARCLFETSLRKALELTWISFHCLPHIKQLVEDFAGKIKKILTNWKSYKNCQTFFTHCWILAANPPDIISQICTLHFFAFKRNIAKQSAHRDGPVWKRHANSLWVRRHEWIIFCRFFAFVASDNAVFHTFFAWIVMTFRCELSKVQM